MSIVHRKHTFICPSIYPSIPQSPKQKSMFSTSAGLQKRPPTSGGTIAANQLLETECRPALLGLLLILELVWLYLDCTWSFGTLETDGERWVEMVCLRMEAGGLYGSLRDRWRCIDFYLRFVCWRRDICVT